MNDVETVDTQLIAHKKEVYEIAYGGVRVFADDPLVFDLREKST